MIFLSEVVVHLEYPELDLHLGGDGNQVAEDPELDLHLGGDGNQVAEVENSVVRGGMVLTGWAD